MTQALVLNATNEPLSVVPGRRAAVLVLDGKADAVHLSGVELRSETLSLPIPSVVRLQYYVRVPYLRRGSLSRRGVLARDDHSCQYCGHRRRQHRPCPPAQPRRRTHLGQRGGGLPALQHAQA